MLRPGALQPLEQGIRLLAQRVQVGNEVRLILAVLGELSVQGRIHLLVIGADLLRYGRLHGPITGSVSCLALRTAAAASPRRMSMSARVEYSHPNALIHCHVELRLAQSNLPIVARLPRRHSDQAVSFVCLCNLCMPLRARITCS